MLMIFICRDVFETIVSNGYRFNGNGYVIVSARRWRPGIRSRITLRFKTYAENGLLFFVNKAKDFLSLEIRDGKVLYQYDLGGGRLQLMSQDKFNDGKWHSVQANRVKKEGLLLVDKKEGNDQ